MVQQGHLPVQLVLGHIGGVKAFQAGFQLPRAGSVTCVGPKKVQALEGELLVPLAELPGRGRLQEAVYESVHLLLVGVDGQLFAALLVHLLLLLLCETFFLAGIFWL